MERPIVFFMPGPIHLFWCTGIFYIWELGKEYQIVLLVSETYRRSEQFEKVCQCSFVEYVDYMPGGIVQKHKHFAHSFKSLVRKFRPQYIFCHCESYTENQYLIHWCKKIVPDSIRIYFQNGRMSLNWKNDFAARDAIDIEQIIQKFHLGLRFKWMAVPIYWLWKRMAYLFNLKLLPIVKTGHGFKPPLNVYDAKFDKKAMDDFCRSQNDLLLGYLQVEIQAYKNVGYKNIFQIAHPLVSTLNEVFEFVHGNSCNKKQILVLPSHGHGSQLLADGLNLEDIVTKIAEKWFASIVELKASFPDHRIVMKLHPSAKKSALWLDVQQKLSLMIPDLQLLPASDSAEWHVVQSHVIVSDVSTVLWWAALIGGKTVISLDIFGYRSGDAMRHYDGIYYIRSISELRKINESKALCQEQTVGKLSLLDFLNQMELSRRLDTNGQ